MTLEGITQNSWGYEHGAHLQDEASVMKSIPNNTSKEDKMKVEQGGSIQ